MELARLIPELPAVQRDTLRIVTHASNIASYLSETRVGSKRSPDRGLYRSKSRWQPLDRSPWNNLKGFTTMFSSWA